MQRILATLATAGTLIVAVLLSAVQTQAADLTNVPAVRHHYRQVYQPQCPERYTCYPLYGAYGPFGGVAYWDAYTGGGDWGHRAW
jgi:hypothetical protein